MNSRANLGLAQGFMQGYGFMDQMENSKQARGLRDDQNRRAERGLEIQEQQEARSAQEFQRQEDARLVQAIQQGLESGNIDPKLAKQFEQRFDVDWKNYLDPDFGNSIETLEGSINGKVELNSPEFRNAFDRVFRKEIQKNSDEEHETERGRAKIRQKRFNAVVPSKDGQHLMVNLDVLEDTPDGPKWRQAPVTDNRSVKDEYVKQIPLDDALRKLMGHKMMYQEVQNSPQLQSMIKQYAAMTGAQLPEPKALDITDAGKKYKEMLELGVPMDQAQQTAYGIKVPENKEGYGKPFNHPELGWSQYGPDGKLYQLKDSGSGDKKPLVVNGQLVDSETYEVLGDFRNDDKKGLGVGTGVDSHNSSVMSQVQQTVGNYFGSKNPDGSGFIVPEYLKDAYSKGLAIAQRLIAQGDSVFDATYKATLLASPRMSEADAELMAEKMAKEQDLGWGKHDDFVEEAKAKIMADQALLQEQYEKLMPSLNSAASNPVQAIQTAPKSESAGKTVKWSDL